MRKFHKKSLAVVLSVVMLLSMLPVGAFAASIEYQEKADDYYNLISKKDWELAPGVLESEIVLNNDAGSHRQVAHVVEVDIHNEYTKVIPSYKGMIPTPGQYAVQTMDKQLAYAEENGYGNVVAAMNLSLSWYNDAYYSQHPELVGEPLGYMILDGVQYTNSRGQTSGAQTCLVINFDEKDGVARPADIPKTQIRSTADPITGWEEQVIPANFGFLVKNGVNQYAKNHTTDPASRSFVGIKADGTIVMVMNDGRQSPYSAGFNSYEMADFMISLGCVYAVNGDGGGSSQFFSQRPGEDMALHCNPSDGGLRDTTHGILVISTAPATGEFVRAQISVDDFYYTPGSSVQFSAIGTDLVGTPADIPAEAQWKLADESMGTIDDNGLFVSNGKVGLVTAQLVYNDKVTGEATVNIVVPDIAFKQDTLVLPYGETAELSLNITTNEGLNTVVTKEGDVVFTLSDDTMGTINGNAFTTTSDTTITGGTLTATLLGDTDHSISVPVKFGKASEIVYDFEDGQFPVDTSKTGNIGGDDAEDTGEYIYGWHINDTRANGHFSFRNYTKKNYTPVGYDISTELYLADRNSGMVRNGDYAMGVNIDWTDVTASCHGQMDIHLPESLDLTDAISVGFWMYIPAEVVMDSMQVSAGFNAGRVDYKLNQFFTSTDGIDNGGWYYFSWKVLDNYKTLDYIQINSHYTAGEGSYNYYQDVTYFIDDITVDYSDATIDRENPYFSSLKFMDANGVETEISGQTITTNNVNLIAQAYENTTKMNATGLNHNSVKVYVDGVLKTENVAVLASGLVTVSNMYLNDGVHTILMEISDNQGNVGNIVRKIVVNTEKSAVRLEVPATDKLIPTGSIYWVNLVADDLATIDSVTTTINLDYVNDWELEGMEVAYGFEAEYYVNAHNDAVITFNRVGTGVADTSILAKLPIRIWMARGWMDDSGIRKDYISNDPAKQDKYYILAPHAMWYSDGTRDYRLVVSAEAGLVTYTDGSTSTFSANETILQTEMNRYYSNTDKQNKWSFHICTASEPQNKEATCTESGYTGRTFCVGCACGSVENLGAECDNHNGCASVIDWGTITPATGHNFAVTDGVLKCACGELYNGIYTDGKTYVDGLVIADGWVDNTYYYLDGVKLTGPQFINGTMYTFNDEGVYQQGAIFEGFYETRDGKTMYFIGNNYVTGRNRIGDDYYTFDNNGYGWDGVKNLCGYDCTFDGGLSVEDDTVLLAGSCGRYGKDNVVYVMLKDGRMIFDGKGETEDFTNVGLIPWYDPQYRSKPTSVFIGKEITSIGIRLLYNLDHVTKVTFQRGSKLVKIKEYGMGNMINLKTLSLPEGVESLYGRSFQTNAGTWNLTITIPKSVTMIGSATVPVFNGVNVTFKVVEGTFAHTYATEKNISAVIPKVDDVNDDATINLKDLVTIARYMADWDNLDGINTLALDVDGNGVVDLADLTRLARRMAGWDV